MSAALAILAIGVSIGILSDRWYPAIMVMLLLTYVTLDPLV